MPNLDEYEYWTLVPEVYQADEPIRIGISAHGGGTIGRSYGQNGWDYVVIVKGSPVIEGSDLRSGAPATHRQMAGTLCAFLSAAGESFRYSGDDSEYVGEYEDDAREFLTAQHERLGMFELFEEADIERNENA